MCSSCKLVSLSNGQNVPVWRKCPNIRQVHDKGRVMACCLMSYCWVASAAWTILIVCKLGKLCRMCLIADWAITDRYVCEQLSHPQHCVMPRFAGGISRIVVKVVSLSGKALNQDLTRTGLPVAFSHFGSKQGLPVTAQKGLG